MVPVVFQKRKQQIDGGDLRYFLLMDNQVTTDQESEWLLFILRYFMNGQHKSSQEKYVIENCVYGLLLCKLPYIPTTICMPKTETSY